MIEHYDFGTIMIDGKQYTSDVAIFPDHVDDHWWRREGHRLYVDDLKDVLEAKPEAVIVGTGHNGLMKVTNEVVEYLASRKIELVVENTEKACKAYNRLVTAKRVVAFLHLTC